jgi:hypothetical protein
MSLSAWFQISISENSFFAELLTNKNLKEMVGNFVELVDTLYVSSYDRFFFLEYSDCSVDFNIKEIPTNF